MGVPMVSFDWSWCVPVAVAEPGVAQILDAKLAPVWVAYWPDVGMSTGRSICCLYNTYLC
jgi:hypothetical protein